MSSYAKTKEEEKDLIHTWLLRLRDCNEYRKPYSQVWKRQYLNWLCKHPTMHGVDGKNVWPSKSAVYFPYSYQVIEQNTMRLSGGTPKLRVVGRTPLHDELSTSCRALLQYFWRINLMNLKEINYCKCSEMYGTAVAFVPWRKEKKIIKSVLPVLYEDTATGQVEPGYDEDGKTIRSSQEFERIIFEGPTFENVHLDDFWIPEGCTSLRFSSSTNGSVAPYCIHRLYFTKEELKKSGRYYNLDKIEDSFDYNSIVGDADDSLIRQLEEAMGVSKKHYADPKITCLFCWTEERLTVIASGGTVIFDGDNPFGDGQLPFVSCSSVMVPDGFYGFPEAYFTESLQDAINAISNLLIENMNLAVDPPCFYDKANVEMLAKRDFKLTAGKMIGITRSGDNAVRDYFSFMEHKPIDQTNMQFIQYMISLYEEATGVTKSIKGMTGADLATDVMTAAQNSSFKYREKLTIFENATLAPLFTMWLDRARAFYNEESLIRITGSLSEGGGNILITPEMLNLDWLIEIEPGSSVPYNSSAEQRAIAMELLKVLTSPGIANYVKMPELLEKFLLEGYGILVPETIIRTAKELAQEMKSGIMDLAQQTAMANMNGEQMGYTEEQQAMSPIGIGQLQGNANGGMA